MNYLIELNGVSFHRPNGLICAQQLNFSLSDQQRIAITGSNGSGKSTLLQMILGLLEGVTGEIKLFGNSCMSEKEFSEFRPRIGYLFQDSDDQLFCPTVIEDICFGPINQGYSQTEAENLALDTLQQLGIKHLANQTSYRLSGGEKKLVSLATILVMKPDVLLLDEPTNGLDNKNYQRFIDIISALNLPLILVSHDVHLRKTLTNTEYQLLDGRLTLQL
ncbi:energy-coupling factor ABC transporter ATP-binding protein [Vibrio sonorensis]|uniref:energy-coupling factor ABC transporter ATP-binding protein n=1 Tax=Vibrio sonorensis TaxID=1004316 RepID=UPI0008DA1D8D|nr:energy-coupling factor ABC transporter ATP-binding protein [Vibrio sonorensis]